MLEFTMGDHIFLHVSPIKGVKRFSLKGKLIPRFIRPFQILNQIGIVTYQLALSPVLVGVHKVLHVSMLRKYILDPTHVLEDLTIPLQLDVEENQFVF